MKFNINNNEGKIVFTFECDYNDPMVAVLFDAIKPKEVTTTQPVVETKPEPAPVIVSPPVTQTRTRRTKAEIEQARLGQQTTVTPVVETPKVETTEPVTEPQQTIVEETKTETTPKTEPAPVKQTEIVVPPTVQLKMDITTDSNDKMSMDIEALQFMIDGDKLAGIKYVKDKTGLDLNSAKTYCDNLWEKHLAEK